MKKLGLLPLLLLITTVQLSAHVKLDYPTGGETFHLGDTVTVQWEIVISHDTQHWDLYLSEDGGTSWDTLKADLTPGTLSYDWVVPNTSTTHARIKVVMVNSGTNYDDASGDFTIQSGTTGIGDPVSKDVGLYPNPASSIVSIDLNSLPAEEVQVRLYNESGDALRSWQTKAGQRMEFGVGDLPRGIYIISVSDQDAPIMQQKVMVE